MAAKIDILYICDWLPPDFGAVGQYSLIFARELALAGKHVALAGLSTQAAGTTEEAVLPGHLTIIKLAAKPYDKTNFAARLFWTLKTNTRLLLRLLPQLRSCNEIIFTGSPPLLLHWIAPLNLVLRKRLVYRITDFHPECSMAGQPAPSLWLRVIYRMTLFWRRRVTAFEALGEDQKRRLIEIGIDQDRIRIKPDLSPVMIDAGTTPLDWPKPEPGRAILLYSGNWGVAHDYETFLQAYLLHHRKGSGRIVLWLNAVGAAVGPIEAFLRDNELPHLRSHPVPMEQLASLLVTPQAHLITLSDPFVGFVLPSKVHGCVASGKPVLYIGSERSDVHRLCMGGKGYYQRIAVGDVGGCAEALEHLADHVVVKERAG